MPSRTRSSITPYPARIPYARNTNDVYAIFSLFFSNAVLDVLIKSTNTYRAQHYKQLKAIWQDISRTELRAFFGVLIYRSLYPFLKHKDYWNINVTRGMCFKAERRPRDYSDKRENGIEVL